METKGEVAKYKFVFNLCYTYDVIHNIAFCDISIIQFENPCFEILFIYRIFIFCVVFIMFYIFNILR